MKADEGFIESLKYNQILNGNLIFLLNQIGNEESLRIVFTFFSQHDIPFFISKNMSVYDLNRFTQFMFNYSRTLHLALKLKE